MSFPACLPLFEETIKKANSVFEKGSPELEIACAYIYLKW